MKFSVIVPIYNVEKYLDTCITSVLEQDYSNFELILVNDGSKDNSLEICKKYQIQDDRIVVINKKNEGLPAARNSGIQAAKGDYILHLDGDDFFKLGYLSYLYDKLKEKNVDVAFGCGRIDYFSKANTKEEYYYPVPLNLSNLYDLQKYMMDMGHEIPASAWSNVYNRKFIVENNLYFTSGLTWSEDTDNYFNILLHINEFIILDKVFYFYRRNNESAMTKKYNYKNIYSNIFVLRKWYKNYSDNCLNSQIKNISMIRFANTYIYISLFARKANKEDREKLCQEIKSDFELIKHCKGINYKLVYYLYRLLGIKITLSIINFIKT